MIERKLYDKIRRIKQNLRCVVINLSQLSIVEPTNSTYSIDNRNNYDKVTEQIIKKIG